MDEKILLDVFLSTGDDHFVYGFVFVDHQKHDLYIV